MRIGGYLVGRTFGTGEACGQTPHTMRLRVRPIVLSVTCGMILLADVRTLWWNFSLMRKSPVELQPYGVLNFSVMGHEVR
jgi:hypothetical protein